MYDLIFKGLMGLGNYGYLNKNNFFNFIILLNDMLNDNQKHKMRELIMMVLGKSFNDELNEYHIKKFNSQF